MASRHITLSEGERRVIDGLIPALADEYRLQALWLFGSRARGEEPGPDSDVDLLAITPGGWSDLQGVTRLLHRVADGEGEDPTTFALFVFDEDWLEDRRRVEAFFIQNVDHDKHVLYERS